MHHKRHRPKTSRAGCLLCKPHKRNTCKNKYSCQTWQEKRAILSEKEQVTELINH